MKKGLFHIHTHYSYDSLTFPQSIVEKAIKKKVNYLVISDHDCISGSIDAQNYACSKGYDIEIPLAAEYRTDVGDIIAVGIPSDFKKINEHTLLCKTVKSLGGYTILPHPFDHHQLDAIDFSLIDCIEVFNSRSSPYNNFRSQELATRLEKKPLYGCDAHFLGDIHKCPFQYNGRNPFESTTTPLSLQYTPGYRLEASQMIKGWKKADLLLSLRSTKRMVQKAFAYGTTP